MSSCNTFPKAIHNSKKLTNDNESVLSGSLERSDIRKRDMNEVWDRSVPVSHMSLTKLTRLKQLLYLRHITDGTLNRFNVRVLSSLDGLIFPRYTVTLEMMGPQIRPSGMKICRLVETINMITVSDEVLPLGGAQCGLFGYHLVHQADNEVVVTLNEADAMAVHQACNKLSIVLPEVACQTNVDQALPYLEDFTKVVVWYPPEKYSRAKQLSKRLLAANCFLISPKLCNNLRAVETLAIPGKGRELVNTVVRQGEVIAHKFVDTLPSLKESVRGYVFGYSRENVGLVQWKRFNLFNVYLKNFRLGELTLLCGPFGCGKKTFLSEYVLDLCDQNVPTLWCGLQLSSAQTIAMMMEQFARDSFHKEVGRQQSFDYWYDQLAQMPLFFARFSGFTKLKSLLEVIDYHAAAQDIQHVVVDNALLITDSGSKLLFGELKRIAVEKNLHITIVVYPKQQQEGDNLSAYTLLGNIDGANEADNILRIATYVHRKNANELEKFLQIWKNRGGNQLVLGCQIEMHFDPGCKCHTLVDRKKRSKKYLETS